MEAANKGAFHGKSPSVGLNIQLPHEQHSNGYQDISQTFRHFFARKYMFVKFASAYVVVMPGGFGTPRRADGGADAGADRQEPQDSDHPRLRTVLARAGGLVPERLVAENMISAEDMNLIQVLDTPSEVVDAIFKHYETRGFAPRPTSGRCCSTCNTIAAYVRGTLMRHLRLLLLPLAFAAGTVLAQAGKPADLQPLPAVPPRRRKSCLSTMR